MNVYKPRIVDNLLKKRLSFRGAVLIEGAKWCGKTTTAMQIARSILQMQNPAEKKQNLEMASINPSILLQGETPRLIDEWQLAPNLWDAVRFEVDQRSLFNQFILTGSAVPADIKQISHTGTGRISRLLMRPMSLFESEDSNGSVSLKEVFEGNTDISASNTLGIEDVAYLICRGGWPQSIGISEEEALQQSYDYLDSVVNMDISRVDNVTRDPQKIRRLLRSYARNVSMQTKTTSITQDVYINDDDNDKSNDNESDFSVSGKNRTINSYIEALKKIFVIEESIAWNPNLRSKTAIRTSNTRYFTDPSIGVASLSVGVKDLIGDLETMGLFFENLCIRDLRVYAQALDGEVYHYRDKNGLECDAVVHLRNGKYGLIEIKLGGDKGVSEGVNVVNKLASNIDTKKMKEPSFKMVITGVGSYAYKNSDGVLIVPIGCLRD